jgi:hypothetical protein
MHCPVDVAVGEADGEEMVAYAPVDDKGVGVAYCVPEELDADPVDVEEGAEELELVLAKLATGGPGNVY